MRRRAVIGGRGSWYADPTGRYEYRFWDGSAWTGWVWDREDLGVDLDAEPSSLTPPQSVTRRHHSITRAAITTGAGGVAASVVALLAASWTHRSVNAYDGFWAALAIAYLATAAVSLGFAALLFGTTSWLRSRRDGTPNPTSGYAIALGSIALGDALSTFVKL